MSEQKRTFFNTTLRPGESPFQLAAEFAGIGIFGLVFLGIGLIPLADGRALGNAALSYVVGSVLCLMGAGLVAVSLRGVWRVLQQVRRAKLARRRGSTQVMPDHEPARQVDASSENATQVPPRDS